MMTHHQQWQVLLAMIACVLLTMAPTAIAASDASVIALNNEGVMALNKSNYKLAIQKFLDALKLDPYYQLAKDNLAITHNNFGLSLRNNPQAALVEFHEALWLGPNNQTTLQNIEGIIRKMGKDPKSFEDRLSLGVEARKNGDFVGAVVEYSAALKLHEDPIIRATLAVLRGLGKDASTPQLDMHQNQAGPTIPSPTTQARPNDGSKQIDYSDYMAVLQRAIKRAWHPPNLEASKRTVVIFDVHKGGEMSDLRIEQSSGSPLADESALKAVLDASPFQPLPAGAPDTEDIQFTFEYNRFEWLSTRHNKSVPTEFEKGPPDPKIVAKLDLMRDSDRLMERWYAEAYERSGNLLAAGTLYERISIALQSAKTPGSYAIADNRSAIDRVRLFKAASESTDCMQLISLVGSCLRQLDKDTAIQLRTRDSLLKQLVESTYHYRCASPRFLAALRSTPDVQANTKSAFTLFLLDASLKHHDNAQHMKDITADTEKYQQILRNLSRADELDQAAFRDECRESYQSALRLYRESLALKQKALGYVSADALSESGDIARVLAGEGRIGEAQEIYEQAIASFRKEHKSDYRYIRLLEAYGDMLARTHQKQRAAAIYAEATAVWKHIQPSA